MKRSIILIVLTFLFISPSSGQKVLQMEKKGKVEATKYYLGQELTFKIKGQKDWINDVILDIKVEENIVVFSERFVKVEDIIMIKSYKNARFAKSAQVSLYSFGAGWLVFSLGGALATGEPLNELAWQVPASSLALGFLFKKIFYTRKYRIGKRRKLRVLDLSFNKDMELIRY